MYVRTILRKRKTVSSLLGTGADADSHETKEKKNMYESEPATHSTLSKVRRTAMSRLVRQMTSLRFIYDVDFKIWRRNTNLTSERI